MCIRDRLERVYKTKISTIHSFCTDIIRENAHIIGISPDFRVMDDPESDILKAKALEDALESRYSRCV